MSRLKEIFQPPPIHPPSDKILPRLLNKNMFREIYRNIQTFAFTELQEWDPWASLNGAVQMLFLKPSRNMFAENILQSQKGFWLCCGSILFSMVGEFRFFEQNYCKMNDLFRWFLLVLWVFVRKSEIKKELWWCPLERVDG